MIREIEFRAKSLRTGKFVYGDIAYNAYKTAYFIHESWDIAPTMNEPGGDVHYELHEVDPKTIGQYTCLKDKVGKKIFEDDLLSNGCEKYTGIVRFENGCFWFIDEPLGLTIESDSWEPGMSCHIEPCAPSIWATVIGNIYDNAELITK